VYQKWAETNHFLSMLPKDAEKRRKDAHTNNQPRLDPHLREKQQKERTIPYTDELFRNAAIEWLVSTDQVCKATFLNFVSLLMKITANPSLRTPIISEHDSHSRPCDQ
jgi:hypothetical protein